MPRLSRGSLPRTPSHWRGPPPGTRPDFDPLALALLAAALGVGLLRFVRLGEWSLWIDEALTLAGAFHDEGFKNPLGYWLVARTVQFLGSADEFTLRLDSALAGLACVPLCAFAFRPALGARAAAAAALLLASSSWHLYWSQSARFYTLAMALGLLGSGLALRGLLAPSAVRYLGGVGLVASSALAHPTGAFLVPSLLAAPFLLRRLRQDPGPAVRRAALVALLLGAVAGLGWAIGIARHWSAVKRGGDVVHFLLTTGFYVTPVLGAGALVGLWFAARRRHTGPTVVALTVATTLGLALLVALQLRMTAQYVFVLLPWIAALAALPVAYLGGGAESDELTEGSPSPATVPAANGGTGALRWEGPLVWVLALSLPALANCLLYLGPRQGERPQWRAAYAEVFARREPGDLVLGMAAEVGEYYLSPGKTDLRDLEQVMYLDDWRAHIPVDTDREGRRTWFVVNREEFEDWDRERARLVERILDENCRLVASFPLVVESRDLSVWVYVRD
jgi:hypothetical protein